MSISHFLLAGALSLSPSVFAADASGNLLLTVETYDYVSSSARPTNTKDKQLYKILFDQNFLAQFKNQPSHTSSGTMFYCSLSDGGMSFLQWFAPRDGKLLTWFWGEGAEKLDDRLVSAHNPKSQVTVKFPSWQALDTSQMVSFENSTFDRIHGLNVSIGAKWVPADDASLKDAKLVPIRGADGSPFVTGDAQDGLKLTASCGFQNG